MADPLSVSMNLRLHAMPGGPRQSARFTIFRVPADVREKNKASYEPRMVSIGPYYHGRDQLRAMQQHKWVYLRDLLSRNEAIDVSAYVDAIRALEARARRCYSEAPQLGADEFVEMLVLDGCFILEFFFKWHGREEDALCDVGWGRTVVYSDLLLLENQIPFFVVEGLYSLVAGPQSERNRLIALLVEYLRDDRQARAFQEPPAGEISHLLHLYHECYVPTRPSRSSLVIPCTTELREAGVRFKRKTSACDMFDITFEGGVMEIPRVEIDFTKRSLMVNLIAFEQSKGYRAPRILTSYVALMGSLICTGKDVEVLQRRGIIDNMLSNADEAARFFNRLGECSTLEYDSHHFAQLFDDVNVYCSAKWPRYRANLMHDYCRNPWKILSVAAAVFLLVLTFLQTYFTVFPRH